MPGFLNPSALEPLFAPWEEPSSHRVRAEKEGEPARIMKGRRPSPIGIAQNIRGEVREWRAAFYAGASDTTRHLLDHWFNRSHRRTTPAGEDFEFRYYFCQRQDAIGAGSGQRLRWLSLRWAGRQSRRRCARHRRP